MSIKLQDTSLILKKAFKKWMSRDPFKESSVIAYTAIFSLPGLMVVIVTLAGYFFGSEIVNSHIHGTIANMLGVATADQVQEMVIHAMTNKDSIWATIIGVGTLLIGATGVFVQLQKSLNIIWEVKAKPTKSGIWTLVKLRLFSFGLILSIAFLLLISLVLTSILTAAGEWIKLHWSDSIIWIFNVLNFLLSLSIISLLFAMMYKIMPDARIKWRYVWVGAFFTAVLFTIGKTLLGLYFGKADPGSSYGAAGSIILILLWVTYSSMILFYGAEFTKAYSDHHYGEVKPNEVAVKKENRVK
ncbi:MAG TPA: YihY/virulence factor BrkB family protein [Saprospiraceae bacterium]|nr:YihY/virulence factor BrkB family protein [Saprospiraceae bacterium]